MPEHILVDGRGQVLAIILFRNGRGQVIHIPSVDVFRPASRPFVDGGDDHIQDQTPHCFGLLTLGQQHAHVQEGTEIKEPESSGFDRLICEVIKL